MNLCITKTQFAQLDRYAVLAHEIRGVQKAIGDAVNALLDVEDWDHNAKARIDAYVRDGAPTGTESLLDQLRIIVDDKLAPGP